MVYLKTIFSAAHEIKYLRLNMQEAFTHIDKFIVCEFNRTHVGGPRELIFPNYLSEFTPAEQEKILYIGADISSEALEARHNSRLAHQNERLMRGYFARHMELQNSDIVFSVDADEIIFEHMYEPIMSRLSFFRPAVRLRLHQFYYRINYLWENNVFIAPTVCRASYYKRTYPGQWRYDGSLFTEIAGCHFSWCLTIDEMVDKLSRYSHTPEYGHLARREVLEAAVREKRYPFDEATPFKIRTLDIYADRQFYPQSLYRQIEQFTPFIQPL